MEEGRERAHSLIQIKREKQKEPIDLTGENEKSNCNTLSSAVRNGLLTLTRAENPL